MLPIFNISLIGRVDALGVNGALVYIVDGVKTTLIAYITEWNRNESKNRNYFWGQH